MSLFAFQAATVHAECAGTQMHASPGSGTGVSMATMETGLDPPLKYGYAYKGIYSAFNLRKLLDICWFSIWFLCSRVWHQCLHTV